MNFKDIVKQMTTRFRYKVKVKQSYDDLTFEFTDINEAATFAQTCLEKCVDMHDGEETQVTITCDKIEMRLDIKKDEKPQKQEEQKVEAPATEPEPVEADAEKEETES